MSVRTAHRTCPLCEACCGLELTVTDGAVTRITGDADDVFSRGFICPKGTTLTALHDDPDRLRAPLVKRGGEHVPVTWDEAFAEVERLLMPVIERYGRDAVAIYIGNPTVHTLTVLYTPLLVKALGTRSVFSASTVDQRPKEISNALLFGHPLSLPVPDIDRTDHLLMLGANPFESNGSLATAPDWPGRMRAIIDRGGTVIVVDPRRTRTAQAASEHIPIRPGTDAYLLAAMATTLFEEGLVDPGPLAEHVDGLDEVEAVLAPFTPEAVADVCRIPATTIRRLARDLAAARSGVVYGRIGTTTQEFGTLASWLVDVLNVSTGNLDRPGGAMFTKAAAGAANSRGAPGTGRGTKIGRWASRVRGLAESLGELPVVCLAEEIETPGEGQIRALVTFAGNPVLSAPNGARLDAALASLECVISIDTYLNETTRHADVILPPPSALQRSHYDLAFYQLAIRNVANYSAPVLPLAGGDLEEWRIVAKTALIAQGMGADADPQVVDDLLIGTLVQKAVADAHSPVHGRDPEELLAALAPRTGPDRVLDFMLRAGPYGDGFGADPDGLTLDVLLANPHGVDLGPLQPRIPEVLRTPSGKIELAHPDLIGDADRLHASMGRLRGNGFVLVGRRHLRSNNSWMHNLPALVKGRPRCTLQLSEQDASELGLSDGDAARVKSRTGSVVVPVEVTDAIMPGVVSIPHGWGHGMPGSSMRVAAAHAGVNSNLLADEELYDALSGNAVLNGIPVTIERA